MGEDCNLVTLHISELLLQLLHGRSCCCRCFRQVSTVFSEQSENCLTSRVWQYQIVHECLTYTTNPRLSIGEELVVHLLRLVAFKGSLVLGEDFLTPSLFHLAVGDAEGMEKAVELDTGGAYLVDK